MKNLFPLLLFILLVSCQQKKNSEYQNIEIEKLNPSPIVHGSLTEAQLQHIKKIHGTFKEVYPISLEKIVANFKRDQHPDREIEVWMAMAETYQKFASKNRKEDQLEKRKEAFHLILMRSMMSEKETIKSLELKILIKKEMDEILTDYQLGKKPIKIETH